MTVLALDIGSSSYKGRLGGRQAAVPAPPEPITPEDVLAAVRALTSVLLGGAARPSCIAITGQMGSHVWVDGGRVIGDVVPWTDRRDADAQSELCAGLDVRAFHAVTGQRVPGLAARYAWGRTSGRAGTPMPLRQWLLREVTGCLAIDPTDASVTGCLDIRTHDWSPAWTRGVPPASLLPVRAADAITGPVTASGARLLGLPEGVR